MLYIYTHAHTMEYYLALKRWNSDTCLNMNDSWRHYTKWKKPVPERTNTVGFFWTSSELPGTVKSIETRSKIEATRGWGGRNVELFNGDRVSGWMMEESWRWWWWLHIEYTKNHWMVHFKGIDCMVCKLDLERWWFFREYILIKKKKDQRSLNSTYERYSVDIFFL